MQNLSTIFLYSQLYEAPVSCNLQSSQTFFVECKCNHINNIGVLGVLVVAKPVRKPENERINLTILIIWFHLCQRIPITFVSSSLYFGLNLLRATNFFANSSSIAFKLNHLEVIMIVVQAPFFNRFFIYIIPASQISCLTRSTLFKTPSSGRVSCKRFITNTLLLGATFNG